MLIAVQRGRIPDTDQQWHIFANHNEASDGVAMAMTAGRLPGSCPDRKFAFSANVGTFEAAARVQALLVATLNRNAQLDSDRTRRKRKLPQPYPYECLPPPDEPSEGVLLGGSPLSLRTPRRKCQDGAVGWLHVP